MKKIAILGNVASMMLNFRGDLIRTLIANGHQVFCFATDYTDDDRKQLYSWGATPIDYTLNSKGLNPFKDFKSILELIDILKELKPDIVFSYFVKPVIFGTIAAQWAKVPRVVGMIEGLGNAFTLTKTGFTKKAKIIQFIQIFLYTISLPKLDALIFLNPDDKRDLVEKHHIKVKEVIILGGIGLDLKQFPFTPIPKSTSISFIFIARLLREKGIFEYLQAAEIIKKRHPEVIFYLLGGFDTENPFALKPTELQQYLESGIVVYPGFVNNIPEWLQKSSVFVLPSYREGVPRSTQEAMAIGRPVITTDVPGCRETVIHGLNGFLIPPFDSVALAQKMQYFIDNPAEIERMGSASRKLAEENFDGIKINEKLTRIILGADS